jgi:hypothetical protein
MVVPWSGREWSFGLWGGGAGDVAALAYRAAFTADFSGLQPIRDLGQLADLGWLDQPS